MTRDEILIMPASREMDALIAQKVLELMVDFEFEEPFVPALRDRYDEWGLLPSYSTDIAAAWDVVEKCKLHIGPTEEGNWYASNVHDLNEPNMVIAIDVSAPLAICRVALLTVLVPS
jgi:hypothetical protein